MSSDWADTVALDRRFLEWNRGAEQPALSTHPTIAAQRRRAPLASLRFFG